MPKPKYEQWITEEGQRLLKGWRRGGLTIEQIAKKIEVSPSTIYVWIKEHQEINDALKKGKELCDFEAEEALLNQFRGHYVEEQITEIYEVDGVQKKHIKKTKKWIEEKTSAIIFYLKCRAGWDENAVANSLKKLSGREELELSVMREKQQLLHERTDSIKAEKSSGELYQKAIDAMKKYRMEEEHEEDIPENDDTEYVQ